MRKLIHDIEEWQRQGYVHLDIWEGLRDKINPDALPTIEQQSELNKQIPTQAGVSATAATSSGSVPTSEGNFNRMPQHKKNKHKR